MKHEIQKLKRMIFIYVTIFCVTLYITTVICDRLITKRQALLLTPTPVPIHLDIIPDVLIIRDQNQNQFIYFLGPSLDLN